METDRPEDIPHVESVLFVGLARAGKLHLDPGVDLEAGDKTASRSAADASARPRYVARGRIGHGGMGVVHRVFDTDLHRQLAMKVSNARIDASTEQAQPGEPTLLERFLEEAHVTGQLDHPGIVPLHELGIDARGRVYFTMRLVQGDEMTRIVELARAGIDGWNEERVLTALIRVCETLAYAHSKGVIHRDLKPANLMVGRFGEVYVMDWGVAKVLGRLGPEDRMRAAHDEHATMVRTKRAEDPRGDSSHTSHGTVFGTPAYMAPEQARGEIELLDARSDVYAVGAILYHWLTGTAPYCEGGGRIPIHTRLRMLLEGPPPPVRKLAPKTDPELAAVCEKAMARDPQDRYASMEALADDLRSYVVGRPVSALPLGRAGRILRWGRKNRFAAGMLVAVLAGSAYGIGRMASLGTSLVHQTALDSAAMGAQILQDVNSLYSSNVAGRVDPDKVEVTHDYLSKAHAIPIPATFLTDLGAKISDHATGVHVRQYSDHPFRFRAPWKLDEFEKSALVALRADPTETVSSFEDVDGRPVLRYAIGRRMEASCVQCHNTHPDSTKTDWKVGDVRGVLEIVRPLDQDVARIREGLSGTLLVVAGIVSSLMLLSALVIVRSASRPRSPPPLAG
jgi:hypothetical protein